MLGLSFVSPANGKISFMISEKEFKRIRWASRRGMLELDLIMVPFVENCLLELSDEDQQRYIDLLEAEDNDLFAWFLGHATPDDPDAAMIVRKIVEYLASKK